MTYRIATVCLGNICRSPMGEAVISSYVVKAGLSDLVSVDSGGTGGWHVGDRPDPRALATLREHGYAVDHRGKQVDASWFADYDLLLAMDSSNYERLMSLAPSESAQKRVRMMRSFDPTLAHRDPGDPELDVPDPYYGNDDGFERVLVMLESATAGLVAQLPDLMAAHD